MSEDKKNTTVTIDNIDYILEDMTTEQQVMVNHIADLDKKINSTLFSLDQLQVGKKAFIDMLKNTLEDKTS